MNKETINTKVQAIMAHSLQNEDGQFEVGIKEQQYAATLVEDFYKNFDTIKNNTDEELLTTVTAACITALKDIQVRDYVLGIMKPEEKTTREFFQWLTDVAPDDYISAPTTLLALTYYEKADRDKAIELLIPAIAKGYSLAALLQRVFTTNWPTEAFNTMRAELHPKVTAGIFGEDN